MKHPLVEVTWHDAKSDERWRSLRDILEDQEPLARVRSVGFLLRKNRAVVVVGHGISDDGDYESTMAIPRACVKQIKVIRRA